MLDVTAEIFNSGIEEDAVLTVGSNSYNIKVLYRNEFEMAELLEIETEDSKPEIEYKESDRNGAKQGDKINIRGKDHYFVDFEPDGNGFIISRLSYD